MLTDWGAAKHYWRHGIGKRALQRERHPHRRFDIEAPVAWFAELQALVDGVGDVKVRKERDERWDDDRWVFDRRPDGRRLVLWVRGGEAQVLTYHHAGEPRRRRRKGG